MKKKLSRPFPSRLAALPETKIIFSCLLFAALSLFTAPPFVSPLSAQIVPTGTLFWGVSGNGGSGVWEASGAWWDGSAQQTWKSGTATDSTLMNYISFVFTGTGRDAGDPYVITTAETQIYQSHAAYTTTDVSTKQTLLLDFQDNYLFKSTAGSGTTWIGSVAPANSVKLAVSAAAGKTVTFDGTDGAILISSGAVWSAEPNTMLTGNGTFNLGPRVTLSDRNQDRVTIGNVVYSGATVAQVNAPTVNMNDVTTLLSARRLYVDVGTLNVNSGTVITTGNPANTDTDRMRFHIGGFHRYDCVPEESRAVVNLNGGYIYSVGGTYVNGAAIFNGLTFAFNNQKNNSYDNGNSGGIAPRVGNDGAGGTFNLNGGMFETSNIYANPDATNATTRFVFNSGTLKVAADVTVAQLAAFINGFKTSAQDNTGKKALWIDTGGAFIDTSAITNRTAAILSELQGVGGLTKLGANTLELAAVNTYTGTTTVSGGTLALSAADAIAASGAVVVEGGAVLASGGALAQTLRNLSGSGTVSMGSGGLFLYDDTDETNVFSGQLVLGGVLEKSGDGAFIIASDNSAFTQNTLVSEGKFLLGDATNAKLGGLITVADGAVFGGLGAATGTVALNTGGILQAGASAADLLTVGSLQLNAGSILGFYIDAGNASSSLNVTNPVAFLSGSAGDIIINLSALVSGTYNLGNIAALNGATILINDSAMGPRQTATLGASGGDLLLNATVAAPQNLVWTGGGTAWNRFETNWKSGATPITFADGDSITFDSVSDTAGARDITIAGSVMHVADLTVAGGGDYSLSGATLAGAANAALAGSQGRLLMQSSGTLTLANSGTNFFAGGIELAAGTLRAAVGGALGASDINVTDNAALLVDTAALDVTGAVSIGGGKTFTLAVSDTACGTISGNITGSGTLLKTGEGLLALVAANSHAATVISAGTLALGHAGALGAGDVVAGASGATLRIDTASFSLANTLSLGANEFTLDTGGNSGAWTGNITGSGTLTKAGSGAINIETTALASSAGLNIEEGLIHLARSSSGDYNLVNKLTGAGTLAVQLTGTADTLALNAGATDAFDGTLAIEDASFVLNASSAAQLARATLGVEAGSHVTKAAGDMSLGGLNLHGGVFQVALNVNSPDGLLAVDALDTGADGVTTRVMVDSASFDLNAMLPNPGVPSIFDQAIGAGGEQVVSAATVTGEGRVSLVGLDGNEITLATTAFITQNGENVAEGTYGAMAGVQADGLYIGVGIQSIDVYAGKELILNPEGAASNTMSASITGAGGVLVQTTGTVIIAGANNTYTGATRIASGVARAGANNIFRHSESVQIDEGAVFALGGFSQEVSQLAGTGKVDLDRGELILNVAANATLTTPITGEGTLTKSGAGTLTLSPEDDRGAGSLTNVNGGRLVLRSALALGTSGTVTVATGAVLEYNGMVNTNNVPVLATNATVDVVNSSILFSNSATRILNLNLINSTVSAGGSVNAIGSGIVNVNVGPGSTLSISGVAGMVLPMNAHNITVENTGRILFGAYGRLLPLNLGTSGTLTLKDGSCVGLSGVMSDGVYEILSTGVTAFESGLDTVRVDAGPNKGVSLIVTRDGDLAITKLTTDPRKDISMLFDAVTAAMSAIYGRIGETLLLPLAEAGPATKPNGLWLKGFGSFAEYDDTAEQWGHSEDTYGIIAGCDLLLRKRKCMAGIYGGFANSKIESRGAWAKADADQQFLGAYGAVKWGVFYAGADVTAGWSRSRNTRALDQPGGSATYGASDAAWYAGSVEIGGVFRPTNAFFLKPFISLHYMDVGFRPYCEHGAAAVQYPDIRQNLLQGTAALRGSWRFTTKRNRPVFLDLNYGWRQDLSSSGKDVTVFFVERPDLPMTIRSGDYARGGQMLLGLGLRAIVNKMTTVSIGYDYEPGGSRERHSFNAGVRLSW